MEVGAFFSKATFSDGTQCSFKKSDIVVFVGPNNSGKSVALRNLFKLLEEKGTGRVVTAVEVCREGSYDDVISWLSSTSYVYPHPGNPLFAVSQSHSVNAEAVKYRWVTYPQSGFAQLTHFFCRYLNTKQRLEAADPPENISLTSSAPKHPIHYLQRDDGIEERVSRYFHQAFGEDLIVHHNPGKDVPLYCGERPTLQSGEDRVSARYLRELEKLPKLHEQGDGMRSFVGVLLHAVIGHHTIVLIDEPEAFLHPPQARLLGKMLAKETPAERQLLVATHSGDVVKGLLDANRGNVRVIRLRREGNVNHVRELDTVSIKRLWSDSLLRHSEVLNGLFHEQVIVCEGDADCRFYAAVLDALHDHDGSTRPDVMFVHCGGKGRIPTVVDALRAVGVPVRCVCDFDVFNDEAPLRPIVKALGGRWEEIAADWKLVRSAIEGKKPELNTAEVRADVERVLSAIKEPVFPKSAVQDIQKVLRRASPWSNAKMAGKTFVPSGEPLQACSRLLDSLAGIGLFVVEVGELEGFARSVGGHGPQWINGVLTKDLGRDPELEAARQFVKRLVP